MLDNFGPKASIKIIDVLVWWTSCFKYINFQAIQSTIKLKVRKFIIINKLRSYRITQLKLIIKMLTEDRSGKGIADGN